MTFIETIMLYFSTFVSILYLIAGGCKTIKSYISKKIDAAAEAKAGITK